MPTDNRRKLIQRRLNKLKQQEGQEALIQKLEALPKDDQSLEAIPEQEWDEMNLDDPNEEPSVNDTAASSTSPAASSTSPAASSQVESSGTTGENTNSTKEEGSNEGKKYDDETGKNFNKERKVKNKKRGERQQSIMPSVESEDGGSETSLFMSDGNSDSALDSDSYYESDLNSDPDLRKSLYTFPAAKASKSGETVGWTGRGIRYGDRKTENNKLMYMRRYVLDIFGIAWKAAGPNPSREDLDLIDPDKVSTWRDVPTKILIAWQGVKEADKLIFKAAQKAQDRYEENQTGKRLAKSKSPSVGLVRGDVERHREKSLGKQHSSPSRSSPRARS
ncbi:hypothetical protein S7711_09491 [Stachybotrys chartarum IBT 7711]|uniref:Uncharacterized protein n=1 Tax=Stachybotrys chartarum (strain CBS 109288 / IBT 7711) TaxID=1280523 RepID=A0A084B870_STACB|nr:hypothetical protein S7711_09491 [Stachybotrys chartarum IBT 7711]